MDLSPTKTHKVVRVEEEETGNVSFFCRGCQEEIAPNWYSRHGEKHAQCPDWRNKIYHVREATAEKAKPVPGAEVWKCPACGKTSEFFVTPKMVTCPNPVHGHDVVLMVGPS